jgi:hypothetical protein
LRNGYATDDQKLLLKTRECFKSDLAELSCQLRVVIGQLFDLFARIFVNYGLGRDRFHSVIILVARRESEEVTRKQQIYDLPPSIQLDDETGGRAAHHTIPRVGPLPLTADFPLGAATSDQRNTIDALQWVRGAGDAPWNMAA